MPLVNLDNFGQLGVIQDTAAESLPINAFTDALNVRFTGYQIEKVLEPANLVLDESGRPALPAGAEECVFTLTWTDALSSYLMAVFRNADGSDYAYRWDQRVPDPSSSTIPVVWEQIGGPYVQGPWQGFAWGDTFIVNNGGQAPQIFNRETR